MKFSSRNPRALVTLPLVLSAALLGACAKDSVAAAPSSDGTAAANMATPTTAKAAAAPGELAVGSAAPEFSVVSHTGEKLTLSALKGKPVVLYFYPRDETPGCTKEACSFRDAWSALEKSGVVLIGVSGDSVESHKNFAAHHKLPFALVSDDGTLAKAYGVGFSAGFASRHTIVIDKNGTIKKVYRDVNVATHSDEILADLKN